MLLAESHENSIQTPQPPHVHLARGELRTHRHRRAGTRERPDLQPALRTPADQKAVQGRPHQPGRHSHHHPANGGRCTGERDGLLRTDRSVAAAARLHR